MVNIPLLCEVMWDDGLDAFKVMRFAYTCGIPMARFWRLLTGQDQFTAKEVDRICTRLRITPDLRWDVFGEVSE